MTGCGAEGYLLTGGEKMFDLHGKTALITGSSRGIGRAILLAFAQRGARVILHCRRESPASRQLIGELEQLEADFSVVYADLGDRNGAAELFRQLAARNINVDILVLNASVELRREWTEINDEEYDLQMDTNFRAPLKLLQILVPKMQEKGWGRVICLGSVQQLKPHPAMLVYSASKAALGNVVRSLATQLAPHGITINSIAPGAIRTDRNSQALSDPAYEQQVKELIPVRYIGCPQDIAGLAVYLASEESRYMTGQTLYVDGGKSL